MKRYHINPDSGNPGLCRAKNRCPFGDMQAEHYDSEAAARKAYEIKQTAIHANPHEKELKKLFQALLGEEIVVYIHNNKKLSLDTLKAISGDIVEVLLLEEAAVQKLPLAQYGTKNEFPDFHLQEHKLEIKSFFKRGDLMMKEHQQFFKYLSQDPALIDVDYVCVEKEIVDGKILIKDIQIKKIWEIAQLNSDNEALSINSNGKLRSGNNTTSSRIQFIEGLVKTITARKSIAEAEFKEARSIVRKHFPEAII